MRISVIGAGHVGLVTGACLAERGHDVTCVDVDPTRIEALNRGAAPIHEAGLDDLLRRNVGARLRGTTRLDDAVRETDLTFVTVGTPFDGQEIDLTHLKRAVDDVGLALRDKSAYHVVVVKSTVVPGTTDEVVTPRLEASSRKVAGRDFGVGVNPEFLTEGEAVHDFMNPDRIVLGGLDGRSIDRLEDVYGTFHDVERVRTNNRTAEMIKYASNALLATMISFSNEVGNLCALTPGVDGVDVMKGVHLSRYLTAALPGGARVTAEIAAFLSAGCGFGGSCLRKDVKALIAYGRRLGRPMPLLEAVIGVNQSQHREIFALLGKHFPDLAGVRVTVLGIAFRPNTADTRESPAIPIVERLLAEGASVSAYDPAAAEEARRLFAGRGVVVHDDLEGAVRTADAIVLVTRWPEFAEVPTLLARLGRQPVLVDGRRMLAKSSVARYEGIGWLGSSANAP